MKVRQILTMVLAAIFVAGCLAGCSSKATVGDAGANGNYAAEYEYGDAIYDKTEAPQESASTTSTAGFQNQKLIRRMSVEAETADMDTLLSALESKTAALGGYVENQSVRNGGSSATRRYRYASLVIRIPADRLEEFIDHVKGSSNITYYQESADDVTLRYVATESRVKALETEQDRLLELLAKAENMSDLLQIEQRLTEVRTELEQVASQLRVYDNLVDYGTVDLNLTEVQEFTVVEEETVWMRIRTGFTDSLKNLGRFFTDAFVWIVVSLPYLIPIGAAAVITVLAVKLANRKKKAAKEQQPPSEE